MKRKGEMKEKKTREGKVLGEELKQPNKASKGRRKHRAAWYLIPSTPPEGCMRLGLIVMGQC